MSRSTLVLICFLVIMGLGAIIVAREFRSTLMTPSGLRISSAQRLRALHTAMLAYCAEHGAWPDSRLTLLRRQRLSLGSAAGIAYAVPKPEADISVIVLWREEILPGAKAGEPWSGRDRLAETDKPAVGHAMTLEGTLLELPEAEFRARITALRQLPGPVESSEPREALSDP